MLSHTVTFNEDQKSLYLALVDLGYVSREFSDFVKDCFYEKIESYRIKKSEQKKEGDDNGEDTA